YGPALDGGDVLVRVEAEAHQVAETADTPAAPHRADGVRGVLDDAQLVLLGNGVQALHVHRQAGKMHRHDGAGARGDRRLGLLQVDVARVEADIDEHWPRPDPHDDVGG